MKTKFKTYRIVEEFSDGSLGIRTDGWDDLGKAKKHLKWCRDNWKHEKFLLEVVHHRVERLKI
jgi:hypothetical protein